MSHKKIPLNTGTLILHELRCGLRLIKCRPFGSLVVCGSYVAFPQSVLIDWGKAEDRVRSDSQEKR
jgi:hypothetical protein